MMLAPAPRFEQPDSASPQPSSSGALRARSVTLSLAATLLTGVLLTVACGAPASKPVGGAIEMQILAAIESGEGRFDHSAWHDLLAAGTADGRVDYDFMAAHRADLDAYLDTVAGAELPTLSGSELKTLLINAYNALTVRSILDHPEAASVRDIDGVWKEAQHRVGGFELTLDALEHNLLRPYFKDPRIHFAVNCASGSCAPLPPWAYDGNRLDEQLDERTRSFLTDPANVRVSDETLQLSSYFSWYGDDFSATGWSPRAETAALFVADYATDEVAAFIRTHDGNPAVGYLDYDWSLNSVPAAGDD